MTDLTNLHILTVQIAIFYLVVYVRLLVVLEKLNGRVILCIEHCTVTAIRQSSILICGIRMCCFMTVHVNDIILN